MTQHLCTASDPTCHRCDLSQSGLEDEVVELRAENERYYLLFTKLQDIAGDRRFSDQFVGQVTRRRLETFAAATKETADGR